MQKGKWVLVWLIMIGLGFLWAILPVKAADKIKHQDVRVVAISTWTVVVKENLTDGYHSYRVYSVYSRLTGDRLSSFDTMDAAEAFIAVFTPSIKGKEDDQEIRSGRSRPVEF